jgi:hypothetical protein
MAGLRRGGVMAILELMELMSSIKPDRFPEKGEVGT